VAAERERYVDCRELAEILKVSTRTVSRWNAEGMPSETWGMKRTRRYLPSECLRWLRQRGSINSHNRRFTAVNSRS